MKKLTLLIGLVITLALAGMVIAANEKAATEDVSAETTSVKTVKNVTYGQCVSENAKTRNTCYTTIKTTLDTCKSSATADTKNKDAVKQCEQTYKKDKNACKATFKSSKKECAKIKHNFFETMRYAFA